MELNDQQRAAVMYAGEAGNILVNAGAGCGKTRTIIARAAHLCSSGTDPARILIMTFTNRAAREIKHRLKTEIGAASEQMQAGTFHAFCLKVMTALPNSFGISGLSIIDTDDQNSLLAMIRKEFFRVHGKPDRAFPKTARILSYCSYSRNTCRDFRSYLEEETDLEYDTIGTACQLIEQYREAKEARGYLDYDDLLERFSSALKAKPKLKLAVCTLFDEVLVDEMQDTNPIQFEILKHFSTEGVRLYCVGDPAQSIYRFRGAEFRQIYAFEELFGSSVTLPLSENYRSFQEILDLSNWLLSRSPLGYRNPLIARRGLGGFLPRVEEFENQSDEAAWIADTILERSEAEVPLSDIMVLYRTGYEAKHLEAELIRRNIPYRFIGGTVLTRSAHVRDLFALLRVIRNVRDDLAWMRFLQLWPRIGERTAESIFRTVSSAEEAGAAHGKLAGLLGADHPAVSVFQRVLESFPVPRECLQQAARGLNQVLRERYDNWTQRSQDMELLVRVAQNYRSTEEFIDDFTLEPLNDTEISRKGVDDAVTLITVHSAKGTEAPICIVAGATQANYPHSRSLGSLDAEEEERRVLYVALTRAKNELIITRFSFQRNAFWVQRSPAEGEKYFLEEIPADLVSKVLHGWVPRTASGLAGLTDDF